jgi:hypothetical protein
MFAETQQFLCRRCKLAFPRNCGLERVAADHLLGAHAFIFASTRRARPAVAVFCTHASENVRLLVPTVWHAGCTVERGKTVNERAPP